MPAIERADLDRFRAFVARRLGLQCDDGKIDHLTDVLRRRMAVTGCTRFDTYADRLDASPSGSEEIRALAEQLTVTETFFFRNADHFQACAQVVLPDRIRARQREKRLRILSAGCASGEEPYSLAVLIREALPDLAAWDVKIIGLDINRSILAKAAQGRYSAWSLRSTPEQARRRYFREDGRDFVLDATIQRMVSFEELNLVDHAPTFWQSLDCDVVFCRNVIMYFTPDVMREVMQRLTRALVPGGFLFLGHAETLRGLSQDYHLCHTNDTFYYQRGRTTASPTAVSAPTRPSDRLPAVASAVADATTSWMDAIQRASDRIASLADGRARRPSGCTATAALPTLAARSWDLRLVLEAMEQERFGEALDLLGGLPAESGNDTDALLLRAVLLTNSGSLAEAEATCHRLLALDELNAGAHYVMALCREHAGDAKKAVEHDQAAIYLDGTFAMPRLHWGLVAKRSGDAATAQRQLEQALALLGREDASRVLLFGGGFSRETLLELCRSELHAAGGEG